ncbi:uncharacterized protein LOC120658729 [Panicum virgatum]|uniref:Uncharacterized protein n=1 Tax=Panicum virgatum TaxID=38727 RepID=A0A8T0VIS8_PANVG|nr:uncharacterized protein LOC120658729 [Panicum virgatum]KAG2632503.1 hypothetical protein PVAP13_2NG096900 [Panicum virgatum]
MTLSYVKILARVVNELGLRAPKIAYEKRANGTFHAVIEVHLVNWTSWGFRGPREFKATSSISARTAIRKAAYNVVQRLEKSGLVKIRDFRGKVLKLWKKRAMEIAKICKEVVEERDELERDFTFLQNNRARLLIENGKMKGKMTRLKKKVSCAMVIKEENARLIAENKDLQAEIRVLKKRLSETKNGDM